MRRFLTLLALSAFASALLVVSPSLAGAGGFCTSGAFTDMRSGTKAGATVVLANSCFTPTILRIDPGEEVTFTNSDSTVHMLGGVNNIFGNLHNELTVGDSVRYTFRDEGVFPYLCILHPGMAGAIVVGDGEGKNVPKASIVESAVLPPSNGTSSENDEDAAAIHGQNDTKPTSSNAPASILVLTAMVAAMGAGFWWLRRTRAGVTREVS
jgi:plastocyanin